MPICSIAGDPMCTVDDSCKYCSGRLSGINSWCHSWPWLQLVQWHIHSSERNLPIHKHGNDSGLEMLWLVERATRINLGPWMLSGTCRMETFCFTWLVVSLGCITSTIQSYRVVCSVSFCSKWQWSCNGKKDEFHCWQIWGHSFHPHHS